MLDESFRDVYTKFKLHFYQEVFSRFQNRGGQPDRCRDLLHGDHYGAGGADH